ncbi:MAG: biosynthetic arginine decarboxylase [Campylobacteraceae bacterium]|nr:biosynthetic arginine decarboxylase [Campylobacteraceae bacterium]
MKTYGLEIWGDDNFIINKNGEICINYKNKTPLIKIINDIRSQGIKGPLLLRFPHLLKKQIDKLYKSFANAKEEFEYKGDFHAVFPLKVNQNPELVKNLVSLGKPYNYGLEAGSKAELLLALAHNNFGSPITVNGFKDEELIKIAFIGSNMGHNITITIEGLSELVDIIHVAKKFPNKIPNIGIRIKLHSSGVGIWAKSGGMDSKFGLTSTELLKAIAILKKNNLLEYFTMIHFHIGSQITDINPVKKALREAGNIYAELRKMGALNLKSLNLGGGLAVEYSQHKSSRYRHYSLDEYANDVTFLLKSILEQKNEPVPDIYVESGRFICASHGLLVAPVLELFSQEYTEKRLHLKKVNPPLVNELYELYKYIDEQNALEYLHDSMDHLESLLTLFDLGYIDLQDRSNTEILTHLITKKALKLLQSKNNEELLGIEDRIKERYLVNFSLFQSLPDFWGIKQKFPVMPLNRLNSRPTRSASLWDITCDSDGEIDFDITSPLFLHDVDLQEEDYFLGFFLVGAYQEVLGMKHNLFTHPTEASIEFNESGYSISNLLEAQSVLDIFEDMDYNICHIQEILQKNIDNTSFIDEGSKKSISEEIQGYLNDNSYLKTTYLKGNKK